MEEGEDRDLGLGLHADVERGDAGGENAGKALSGEGVEEVKARAGEAEEAPPLLHHADARLVDAGAEHEEGVHHFCSSLPLPSPFALRGCHKKKPNDRLPRATSVTSRLTLSLSLGAGCAPACYHQ